MDRCTEDNNIACIKSGARLLAIITLGPTLTRKASFFAVILKIPQCNGITVDQIKSPDLGWTNNIKRRVF